MARRRRLGVALVVVLAGSLASSSLEGAAALGRTGIDAGRPPARSLFPVFDGAVPVLLYHRLAPGNGGYSVAPAAFDAQLRRLHELGFETITLEQYVRFARGEAVDLPRRPILITFDDAYRSAWENADAVLGRYGWSAVMYVPTGAVGRPGHVTWEELRRMRASGRWQIDEHAGDGHVVITADALGRRLPFYAAALWANGRKESFARYKQRVRRDIDHGAALLSRNLPGWRPDISFAVPFNNYGQNGSNDARIEPWLSGYLTARFAVVFVQRGNDSFTTARSGLASRISVSSHWDADELEARLRRGVEQLKAPAGAKRASGRPRRP